MSSGSWGFVFDKIRTPYIGLRQHITSQGAAGTWAPVRVVALQAGEPSLQPMALCLNGLKIHLGPELRAMFPVVLNMDISGDIELNGAADPDSLRVAGTIHLDGGEVRFTLPISARECLLPVACLMTSIPTWYTLLGNLGVC